MFEFDFRLTVTKPSKGKLVPFERIVEVPKAANLIDSIVQMKKILHRKDEQLYVMLDVQCFKRNIRKERVVVTNDELEEFNRQFIYTDLNKPRNHVLTRKKDPWDF